MKKIILLLPVLVLAFQGCTSGNSSNSGAQADSAQVQTVTDEEQSAAATAADELGTTNELAGTVGDQAVEMTLKVNSEGQAAATCRYISADNAAPVALAGNMVSGSSECILTEDNGGESGATWSLHLNIDAEGRKYVTGTVTDAKGQVFNVKLTEVAEQ